MTNCPIAPFGTDRHPTGRPTYRHPILVILLSYIFIHNTFIYPVFLHQFFGSRKASLHYNPASNTWSPPATCTHAVVSCIIFDRFIYTICVFISNLSLFFLILKNLTQPPTTRGPASQIFVSFLPNLFVPNLLFNSLILSWIFQGFLYSF